MGSLTRFPAHLTQLYTEAKRSALNNTKQDVTYTHSSIDREFRTQKDRLLAWGLEWSDGENGSDGNIDEPAARAGLTAAVSSVLSHIKEVLIQAEGIRRSVLSPNQSVFSSSQTPEKTPWSVLDEAECKGLLQDLTTSIDALCDLARARKALASGTHPTFSADEDDEITDLKPLAKKPIFETSSFASSEVTLVNPVSFSRPVLSPYAGAPPHIDFHALLLPPESPPSYDSIGMPSATRQIAHLLKSKVPLSVSEGLHGTSEQVSVLVEYANFDSVYRDTGVNPPLERLISLAGFLRLPFLQSEQGITLLGYFEDPHQPRIGLVYDFIGPAHEGLDIMMYASGTIAPVSLLNVLQKAHRASKTSDNIHEAPALELRFQMGLRITEKIKELHDHGLAHGNISSGNAIIFKNRKDERLWPTDLRHLILSSFDIFSREV
ncbi:hypothetical protein H2203_004604 [Taxawa tesnikishii (nom. ined.)]|nr:hypothetical protein H2203_004604 [Dothideales sp. JES 119]